MSRSIAAAVPWPPLMATIHWGSVGPLRVSALAIMGAWLIAGASLASMLRDPHRARIINPALAAAPVGATAPAILR